MSWPMAVWWSVVGVRARRLRAGWEGSPEAEEGGRRREEVEEVGIESAVPADMMLVSGGSKAVFAWCCEEDGDCGVLSVSVNRLENAKSIDSTNLTLTTTFVKRLPSFTPRWRSHPPIPTTARRLIHRSKSLPPSGEKFGLTNHGALINAHRRFLRPGY